MGTLDTALAAGAWSRTRKKEAGYIEDDTCPHCHQAPQTDKHMRWACPTPMECGQADLVKSNAIRQEALEQCDHTPCFWLRGITPKRWTFRNTHTTTQVWELPGGSQDQMDSDGHFFLDGFGGLLSKDPRLRVCGWAWVQPGQQVMYPAWHTCRQYP